MKNSKHNAWWEPIIHIAGHVITGFILFFIIGAPAVGLSFLVGYLEEHKVSAFTVTVLTYLEHVIMLGDSLLFTFFLVASIYKDVKELFKS